jgi:hypothetical protein
MDRVRHRFGRDSLIRGKLYRSLSAGPGRGERPKRG